MLTARNVILATVLIAVVSLGLAAVSLLQPPGDDGLGGDTYGTRGHGHRALYEILAELRVPVDRSLIPPTGLLDRRMTLVLWDPHQNLVAVEPVYLRRIAQWVRRGGRVVVAPGDQGSLLSSMAHVGDDESEPTDVLDELGLEGVGLLPVDLERDAPGRSSENPAADWEDDAEDSLGLRRLYEQAQAARRVPVETVSAHAEGTWSGLNDAITELAVPAEDLQVLDTESSRPAARLLIRTDSGDEFTAAALYRRGAGEIVVVGDPRLLENRLVARSDNPVLAYHLLADSGRPIVFDEFYHGLTIRGNPLYLATRPPYGLITIVVLAAIGVWLWRRAVALGPPLPAPVASRRTVAEYVDAMARLFQRGRSSRPFLLREFRQGALWTLRQELGLPPGREQPDEIAAALARQDPRRAQELRQAVNELDRMLSSDRSRPNDRQIVEALERVSACL